jgi:hypothetical protein
MNLHLLTLALGLLVGLALAGPLAAADSLTSRLEQAGIQPSERGVLAYLESLTVATSEQEIDSLIAELDHDSYDVRERATQRLARIGPAAAAKLRAAAKGTAAEASLRARLILARHSAPAESPVVAALEFAEQNKLKLDLAQLLKVHDHVPAAAAKEAAILAMIARVQDSDRPWAEKLLQEEDAVRRNVGRRLLAKLDRATAPVALEGTFDAVKVTTGGVSGGGRDLVDGWEFKATSNMTVTHLGIYDNDTKGLATAHELAIWDVDDPSAPVVSATIAAGADAPLAGTIRFVPVKSARLTAGKRYAIVALYPTEEDSLVSLINPSGLTIEYAPHFEVLARRYGFPHKTMAFPHESGEGVKQAMIGPSFRYQVADENAVPAANK